MLNEYPLGCERIVNEYSLKYERIVNGYPLTANEYLLDTNEY